jgi:Xaa-Pro aminopeptidase
MMNQLSVEERDRRYSVIRAHMKERGLDCIVVSGSSLFYLTNGLAGEMTGVMTAEELPFIVGLHRRYLADIEPQTVIEAQDWVKDIRRRGDDPAAVVGWIRALQLENGTIGLAIPDASYRFYAELQKALAGAKLVDATDILANVRTIKSEEEIALIDRANMIFDEAVEAIHQTAKPGMTGAEVMQEGIKAMWNAGGDIDSTFSFNFGPVPAQNPVLAHLCLDRSIKPGDVGTLTAHAEFRHYGGHSDQEISFGEPKRLHKDMFDAVATIREAMLAHVRPSATQRDLLEVYDATCKETGFRPSPHAQVHQYGIDVPEFPGPQFQIPDPGGNADPINFGRVGNFILASGMIYSISPTILAPDSEDAILAGTSLVVTDDGYRELGNRKLEFLVVSS